MTPYIFKGQTNRITKHSSTYRPTEHDFEKKLGGHFDSRLEIGFENAWISYKMILKVISTPPFW